MKNTIVKVNCEDMTVEGYGVCKYDGLVIFVKELIIGETAMVKIIAHKKNYAIAIIDELLVRSEHRIEPRCKVAYKCGGCDLRHIDYNYQLELKKKWLKTTLKNIADIDLDLQDIVPSPRIDRYRNKVQVPVSDRKIGFYRTNSHDIVECNDCLIETKRANEVITFLKEYLVSEHYDHYFRHIIIKEGFDTQEMMVAFVLNVEDFNGRDVIAAELVKRFPYITSIIANHHPKDNNVILGEKEIVLYGSSYIVDKLDGLMFKISLKSFYQINPQQTTNLYGEIIKSTGITGEKKVLDLYSGIGTIAIFLARYAKKVIGVEVVKEAVENAKDNAMMNKLSNVEFYYDDASNDMSRYMEDIDIVVVDPPRKGLNENLIDTMVQKGIPQIAYVSCNPATLARDLKLFISSGYKIKNIRGFDMFPHTTHIETVVLLSKGEVDSKKIRVEFSLEDMDMSEFQDGATYPQASDVDYYDGE